jgi:hypothetical protein
MTTKTETIRALNDGLRQNLTVGTAFITAGVAALGPEAVGRIVKTIAVYDDFCHANDAVDGAHSAASKCQRWFVETQPH